MHEVQPHTMLGKSPLTRTLPPLLLALWLLGATACSPRAGVTEDGDVVADGGLSDFAAAEVLSDIELDGTDVLPDVADAIQDVPAVTDANDTGLGPCSPEAQDIQYIADWGKPWLTEDIDISHLGFVAPPDCPACGLYREVSATDAPTAPECAKPCPPGYPCTCGVCPWVKTPNMNHLRFGATALWAEEEVFVFGGKDHLYVPDFHPPVVLSVERWNPGKAVGFQDVDLPFQATSDVSSSPRIEAVWTGKEVIAATYDKVFRLDPKTSKVTVLPPAPVVGQPNVGSTGDAPLLYWSGSKLFVWGFDPHSSPFSPSALFAKWSDAKGWELVAMPWAPPTKNLPPSPCSVALDGAIYAFFADASSPSLFPANLGLDPKKPVMVRFDMASETWEVLPQNSLPGIICDVGSRNVFSAFDDGIVMIPPSTAVVQAGQVWWKATGQWIAMPALPFKVDDSDILAKPIWTGKLLIIPEISYADPQVGKGDHSGTDGAFHPGWPMTYDPYANRFGYVTSVGFPKHGRAYMAWAASGSELFAFGGHNGIYADTLHAEGYRLPLPQP